MNLLLKGRLCLVLGAGKVASRKVQNLVAHDARVLVVAPEAHADIQALADDGRIELRRAPYRESLLAETRPHLVYAATDDDKLNRRIVAEAGRAGILNTSASSWQAGDFICPSIVPWRDGQVSVTTEGRSCRQARFMRERLTALFGAPRSWLLVTGPVGAAAPPPAHLEALLAQLAGLEELVVTLEGDTMSLWAWAAEDRDLVGAVLRLLDWAKSDQVEVVRGEAVLARAALDGGDRLLPALDQAVEARRAGIHLEALRRHVAELATHA